MRSFTTGGGNANSGGINNVGSNGYYWSSTPGSSAYTFILYLGSSGANPSDGNYRYRGYSVRCLMKTNSDDFWEPDSLLLD